MNLSKFDLTGRTAIVTGGGRGIGKGICLALAQAGANIAVAELDPDTAKTTAQEVQTLGVKSLAIPTDVCIQDQVELMTRKTVETFGTIDILVNNVGGMGEFSKAFVPTLELSEDAWDTVVDINLKSCFLCSVSAAKVMVKQKRGNIVNISSGAGLLPYPECIAYGASKAGVINLTQSLATILGPYNIRVNVIAPGPIATEGAKELLKSNPELLERRQKAVPLGRLGRPEDIAWTVVFLASDAAGYVDGQCICVDGAIATTPDLFMNPGVVSQE